MSLLLLFLDRHVVGGFEVSTSFLSSSRGENDHSSKDARLYNLGLSMLMSTPVKPRSVAPYVKIGLDLAAASELQMNGSTTRDVMLGVHGNVGVHGMVSDRWVWRAEVGYHGAGVGGLTASLGLGYVFLED